MFNEKEYFNPNIFEPKLYLSKFNFFIKFLIFLLILVGMLLMLAALKNKSDLEEFFLIPLMLGILDFLLVFFLVYKNIGYKIYFTGREIIISKFSKEVTRINLKKAEIVYKKRLLYESIEFYEKGRFIFFLPSYWFLKEDFKNLKNTILSARKYFKILES